MSDFKIDSSLASVGQAATSNWLEVHGYEIAHTGCALKYELRDDFVVALQLEGYTVCDLRDFDGTITAFNSDRSIFVRATVDNYTDIYTNKDIGTDIAAFFKQFRQYFHLRHNEDPEQVEIEYFYHTDGCGVRSVTIDVERCKIPRTYAELYPDYDIDELVKQYVASPESILLLYGIPGVGKTQFIRHVMKQGSFDNIVYVKDQKVLQASSFWADMSHREIDLMIFDDMDEGLQPRKNTKGTDFTSNLLSFSNGIFDNNTKIIITTNQEIDEIDAALVRPGRCFDFLTLHPLTYDQARAIWCNVLKQPVADFERLYSGQLTVTQASLMSDYNRENHSFTERSYVKHGNKNYNVQKKLQESGVKIK